MRILFIDRNIASKILSDFKKCSSEEINFIKSLDKKGNLISLLFSNLEGRAGIPQSINQSYNGITKESEAVNKFFKKAQVDSGFFLAHLNLSSWSISSHQKDIFKSSAEIISYMQDLLFQPHSLTKAKEVREHIYKFAEARGVEVTHPIVLCGLATLYGNTNAFYVLKPRKPKENDLTKNARSYNALLDLMVIVHLSELIGMSKNSGIKMNMKFITLDKPLREFIDEFIFLKITKSRFVGINSNIISLGINMSLFPRVAGGDADELREWISKKEVNNLPLP